MNGDLRDDGHCFDCDTFERRIAELENDLIEAENKMLDAQKEARELRALMLKCHDVQDLHDIYSVDGYAPPVGMTDRLRDVLAQARAERDTQ